MVSTDLTSYTHTYTYRHTLVLSREAGSKRECLDQEGTKLVVCVCVCVRVRACE